MSCTQAHSGLDETPTSSEKLPAEIVRSLELGLSRDVLVELVPEASSADSDAGSVAATAQGLVRNLGGLPTSTAAPLIAEDVDERASYYADAQQALLDAIDRREVMLLTRYQHLPFMFVRVTALNALYALANRPEVQRVHADRELEHQLADSLPLIKQPTVAADGHRGAGTSVAVLDTGCDYTHPDFGTCNEPGDEGCHVAYAADFATNDDVLDDHGHGTNVSAIVRAVAPETKLLALDVFAGVTAPASAILAAIDWTIDNRSTYNIVAMNMSLGGGASNSVCYLDLFTPALINARAAGIVPIVASGNNGFTGALASPACSPASVSVGAVYDADVGGLGYPACTDTTTAADQIACFSNSASFLSLLAPGASITAGGYKMTGTSQATPHVAGAFAVLRSAFPLEAVDATIARLTDSGPTITDPRNGITKRRLDLQAALRGAVAHDNSPPSGNLVINSNQPATNTTEVALSISASDLSGIDSMCISNAGTCSEFVPYRSAMGWTLPPGDGEKTVRVAIQDAAGNQTVLTDRINLDTTPPVGGTLRAVAKSSEIALTWSAARDSGSGIDSYRLVFAADIAPSCTEGTLLYQGSARMFTHTDIESGRLHAYRLCPVDGAGNIGAGSTASARPAPEFSAPVGTVVIDDGSQVTRSAAVTLTLQAEDPSGVARMCISNTNTGCSAWEPYAQTKEWMLRTSNGTTSVYAWFEDSFENRTATPAKATIQVDPVPPTGVALLATEQPTRIELSWPAASDPSGVTGYRLVAAAGSAAPESCDAGTVLYDGPELSFTHDGLTTGEEYGYRLCAIDGAGNVSLGAVRTAVAR